VLIITIVGGQMLADDGTGLYMKLFISDHNKTSYLRLVPSIPVTGIAKGPVLCGSNQITTCFLSISGHLNDPAPWPVNHPWQV